MLSVKKTISKLLKKKYSISVAESCTGGLISKTLTKESGVSKIFSLGLVCYSNETKMKYLSISKRTLEKYGAVSSNVAKEMIEGLYRKEKTDICVSTTGIAGPNGGTKNKPVGLVFIGIKINKKNYIFKKNYRGSRTEIQNKTKNFIFKKINELI